MINPIEALLAKTIMSRLQKVAQVPYSTMFPGMPQSPQQQAPSQRTVYNWANPQTTPSTTTPNRQFTPITFPVPTMQHFGSPMNPTAVGKLQNAQKFYDTIAATRNAYQRQALRGVGHHTLETQKPHGNVTYRTLQTTPQRQRESTNDLK